MKTALPINSTVIDARTQLFEKFASAEPFPHIVIDDFLTERLARQLLAEFPRFDPVQARAETGQIGRKAVVENMGEISPAFAELHAVIQSDDFLSLIGDITGIKNLLFDPEYYGGGTHENLTGQGLHYHVDFNYHPIRKWHRRLNLIIFLNHEWQREWGGNLQLIRDAWQDRGEPDVEIEPVFGRAVIFETSERSWHGFEAIGHGPGGAELSRKSIALYFYTVVRPPNEITAEHGTYYVGRPLPQWCSAGLTLTDEHVAALRDQISQREQWVKFMYEREVKWSSEMGELHQEIAAYTNRIVALERSRAYRIGRLLTAPARLLRRK